MNMISCETLGRWEDVSVTANDHNSDCDTSDNQTASSQAQTFGNNKTRSDMFSQPRRTEAALTLTSVTREPGGHDDPDSESDTERLTE